MNTKLSRLPRLLLAGLVALLVLAACTTSDPVTRLTLSTDAVTLAPGETAEVTASLKTRAGADHLGPVVWASADEDVATVAAGTITAVSAGETVVTASFSNLKAEVAVTVTAAAELEITGLRVTPGHLALILGELTSGQLTAAFEYEDGSTGPAPDVTWSSASAATATVSNTGAVTAVAAGSTRVTASAAGFTATANLTVVDPVTPEDPVNGLEVVPGDVALLPGGKVHVIARFTHESGITSPAVDVTWSSNADGVATVEDGEITAVAAGTAEVTATASGQTATVAVTVTDPPAPEDSITGITVSPASLTLDVFEFDALSATFTHASGATSPAVSANWSSSDDSVVTASAPGILQATGAGTATVTVSSGDFTATASITVVDPVVGLVIKPSLAISIGAGDSITLAASTITRTGVESDVTAATTWSSSDSAVAALAGNVVEAITSGVAEITAEHDGITAVATVSVSSLAHVFVGNAPAQPAGPLGNQLNPFPTIGAALARVDDDAIITLLAGWNGIEDAPVELVSHKLIGAGIDESIISFSDSADACYVISLGDGASISDLSIDGTNVSDSAVCSGAGPRGVSAIGASGVSISSVHVYDDTSVTDAATAAGRNFIGIHLYRAGGVTLSDVRVSNTTRDAIQVSGGDVTISGAVITNAAQFQPGYGGIAAYSNTSAGNAELTVEGDISFLNMADNAGFILSSTGAVTLTFEAGDATLLNDETRFPLAVWRGGLNMFFDQDDFKGLGVQYYALGLVPGSPSLHNGFVVGVASDDPQDAVDVALSYKHATDDIGPHPLVVDADLTTFYVGQSSTDTMSIQDAVDAAAMLRLLGLQLEVEVLAGTYQQQVAIGHSVALRGAGVGQTVIVAPEAGSLASAQHAGPGTHSTYAIINIDGVATSANLSGLTVSGPFTGMALSSSRHGYGIRVAGGAHLELSDSEVIAIRNEPFDGAQAGIGLVVGRQSETTHGTAELNNVDFYDFQKGAIVVDNVDSHLKITGGTLEGIPTSITAQNGIQISNGATAEVEGVTLRNFAYTGADWVASAILSYGAGAAGISVMDSTFENFDTALFVFNGNNETYHLENNRFTSTIGRGFYVQNHSDSTIELAGRGNEFDGQVATADSPLEVLFDIERRIFHAVDSLTHGLVMLVADNLYAVDTDTLRNAITAAQSGMTVNVAPGTYPMTIGEPGVADIDKPLTLRGPNAGIDGIGNRGPEANLVASSTSDQAFGIRVTSGKVTVDGFLITTDTPLPADPEPFAGGIAGIRVTEDAGAGVVIQNNIVLDANSPIWVMRPITTTGTKDYLVQNNLIEGPGASSDQAIYLQHAAGDILNNVIRDARVGIQVQPYSATGNGTVDGNVMDVFQVGLWFNYSQDASSNWSFTNNSVTGIANPQHWNWPLYTEDPSAWSGIRIETFEAGNVTFNGNSIDSGNSAAIGTTYLVRTKNVTGGLINGIGTADNLGEFFSQNSFPEFPAGVTTADISVDDGLLQLIRP